MPQDCRWKSQGSLALFCLYGDKGVISIEPLPVAAAEDLPVIADYMVIIRSYL